ncbi:MAG: DUF4469 domain-containing protein [Spirochaetaceae bacterium]|nr:DUF4469 domain-containing protein [Spirochaetaceae bacterium]
MAHYSLRDNPFTADPADRVAKVEDVRSYSTADIIQMVIDEGSTLNRADIEGAVKSFFEKCAKVVSEGGNLNTELVSTSLSISGVFENADDSFDPKRHTLKINATAGSALKDALKKVKLTKVAAASTDPNIVSVADKVTGAVDGDIKAGSVIKLSGNRLKFDASDNEQGVFIIGKDGEKRHLAVIENIPSSVVVLLPADLTAGEVSLELRTKMTASQDKGKKLKCARYGKSLSIIA